LAGGTGRHLRTVPENTMYRWKEGQTAAEVLIRSRAEALTAREGFREQGSNGLGVDAQGRLVICQHGERRSARAEAEGTQTTIAVIVLKANVLTVRTDVASQG